jgi:hypothetical protein
MAMPTNAAPMLPILATVGQAFRLLWLNRDDFIRVAIIPVTLSFALALVALGVGDEPNAHPEGALVEPWAVVLVVIAQFMLTTLFSVGWLRVLLVRGERNRRDFGLHWTRAHSQFLGRFVLLCIVLSLALTVLYALAGSALPGDPLAALQAPGSGLVLLLASVVTGYLSLRLSLVFPAAAVEHAYGFAQSWRHTARQGFALVLVMLIVIVLVAVVWEVIHTALFGIAPFTTLFIEQALSYVISGAVLGVLAIVFHRVSGWREPPPPAPPPGSA